MSKWFLGQNLGSKASQNMKSSVRWSPGPPPSKSEAPGAPKRPENQSEILGLYNLIYIYISLLGAPKPNQWNQNWSQGKWEAITPACNGGRVPPLSNKMGPPGKKIEKLSGRFGAPGASDLDGGGPGDHLKLLFMFWDALEPKFWPKNHFDTFPENYIEGFYYITGLFWAPRALGTSPSDSS